MFSSPARSSVSVVSVLLKIPPSYLHIISVDKRTFTITSLPIFSTNLRSHPLTSSLHCTTQKSPSSSINVYVLLLTSVSGSICYTERCILCIARGVFSLLPQNICVKNCFESLHEHFTIYFEKTIIIYTNRHQCLKKTPMFQEFSTKNRTHAY